MKALNWLKKASLVVIGLIMYAIDYTVYVLDGFLIALFPRSNPSFRGWQGKGYVNNFKRYSYIRLVAIAVITTIILLIF